MPLSNLPGPWRWYERNGLWWRVHEEQSIEDGPHTWAELNVINGHDFGSEHYDRQGKRIPFLVAAEYLNDLDYKTLAKNQFILADDAVEVSTVWLGLNMNWMPGGRLKIFETMIFGGELDLEQWRYSTEEEALAGHAETCRLVEVIAAATSKGESNDHSGS